MPHTQAPPGREAGAGLCENAGVEPDQWHRHQHWRWLEGVGPYCSQIGSLCPCQVLLLAQEALSTSGTFWALLFLHSDFQALHPVLSEKNKSMSNKWPQSNEWPQSNFEKAPMVVNSYAEPLIPCSSRVYDNPGFSPDFVLRVLSVSTRVINALASYAPGSGAHF